MSLSLDSVISRLTPQNTRKGTIYIYWFIIKATIKGTDSQMKRYINQGIGKGALTLQALSGCSQNVHMFSNLEFN